MTEKTRILLIGCGGIGTVTSFNLEASGQCHVTAVLRSNYDVVKEKGFTIDSIDHGKIEGYRPSEIRKTIPNITTESIPPYDYIIITTKNLPDIPPPLTTLIAPALSPSHPTAIVLIQNGLNIHLPFLTAFPTHPILSGISRMGANELSPGVILNDDPDRLSIGVFPLPNAAEPPSPTAVAAAQKFVHLYSLSGKPDVTYNAAVKHERWRKLLYNATWNPICALTNLDTGRIRLVAAGEPADPLSPMALLLRPAMREVVAVARADGVQLEEGMIEEVLEPEPVEVHCQPSMLQDKRKGRAWEVENLLGEVVRIAVEKGVEVPVLGAVYGMARSVMWGLREEWGVVKVEEERERLRVAKGEK